MFLILLISQVFANEVKHTTSVKKQYPEIQFIRNATLKINYGKTTILIDPMLAPKGAYPSIKNAPNSNHRNPMLDLPLSTKQILNNVDAVIITHTHNDHWDHIAQQLIRKNMPIFVQNKEDERLVKSQGFLNVHILNNNSKFAGISLHKISGQHGTDKLYKIPKIAKVLGKVSGIVLEAPKFKTIYIASDTLWTSEVDQAINLYKPSIIILNTGYALSNSFKDPLLMGKNDILKAYRKKPKAKIISIHMDVMNPTTLKRSKLLEYLKDKKMMDRVFVPFDGEIIKF
ncbi:TPA: MBL fold metallo-hydrolase [Acinetobacter baumannii]|nr:MBL fold metallo-hydrolase [Acinetobacter baumannii]